MLVIKVCASDWKNASRDKRELSAVKELGGDCLVFSKGLPKDKGRKTSIDGFDVYLYTTKPLGTKKIFRGINRILTIFMWSLYLRKYRADILTCHDLSALIIGWLSTLFIRKKNKPILVYDSHEYEVGRCGRRSKLNIKLITIIENFLIRKCSFSIMVNETIAHEVKKLHNLKKNPIVVRNTPYFWQINSDNIKSTRHKILSSNGLNEDTFIIMYHGGLNQNRGIETLIEVVSMNPNVVGLILGNGSDEYTDFLHALAKSKKIENRIIFHDSVSIDELWMYVGAADVGLVLIQNICLNNFYSLPNKLFENIQSLTPIIGSNYPEIDKVINGYKIGFTCNPYDIYSINDYVEKIRTQDFLYSELKNNLIIAKQDLCWENEKKNLVDAYKSIIKNNMS